MTIEGFLWLDEIVDKLFVKHNVNTSEVEEVFANNPRIRLRQRGDRLGENVYVALGRTDEGRYLMIAFIRKLPREEWPYTQALILSARDMAEKERKQYERK